MKKTMAADDRRYRKPALQRHEHRADRFAEAKREQVDHHVGDRDDLPDQAVAQFDQRREFDLPSKRSHQLDRQTDGDRDPQVEEVEAVEGLLEFSGVYLPGGQPKARESDGQADRNFLLYAGLHAVILSQGSRLTHAGAPRR
jgi:hypothetical protein